jgi:DNA-binding MarR family transcriptional regulator
MPDHDRRRRAVSFIIRSRTDRKKFFPVTLLSEPAWDMLLKLYAAAIEKRAVSLADLARTANVGPSAAARWVSALEQEGFVSRPSAQGVDTVSLTEKGWLAMDSYFENMSSGQI